MNQDYSGHYQKEATVSASAFASLMRSVYIWMTFALTATGLTAAYVAMHTDYARMIASNQLLFWGLMIAELALVLVLSARINRLSFATAGLMFATYSILNGVTLSIIFIAYDLPTIETAFYATAGTFAAMALVGSFIKRDLSIIGRFLLMAVLGLIVASVVNLFMENGTLHLIISYAGVLIFSGLTAYDAQKIKVLLLQHGGERNETTMKIALMGSLSLYLDFINLFLYMLRIFGSSRD